ncbi:putative PAN domain-containing protein 1, partial [Homarus americanus]
RGQLAWVVVLLAVLASLEVRGHEDDQLCVPPEPNDDHPIPDYSMTLSANFTLTLEMTSEMKARERRYYHSTYADSSAVSLRQNGTKTVYHYYPLLDKFITQYGDHCQGSGAKPKFEPWGWFDSNLTHGDKNYGPSSILRLSTILNTEFVDGDVMIEGVKCERWRTCSSDGAIEIMFTFSGLSCENRVSVINTIKIPSIPWHFSLSLEDIQHAEIEGKSYGNQQLDRLQLTYAGKISLVSLNYVPKADIGHISDFQVEIIHDFNTGVQYTVNREYGNCSLDFIPPYSFDSHFAGYLNSGGSLLAPNDLFHIDKSYSYVGERPTRHIDGDMWTDTRLDDIPDPDTGGTIDYPKAVLDYYFTQGIEVTPAGNVPVTMPMRRDLFVYNRTNIMQEVEASVTNFYDFQKINLYSEQEFSVQECYEQHDDRWSFVDIFFPATQPEQFILIKNQITNFKHNIILLLTKIGNMSPVRIADIEVNDGISGLVPNTTDADTIFVSIKLLERAPYLFSYREPVDHPFQVPGDKEPDYTDIQTLEDCAALCTQEMGFMCQSFHHCDDEICFLSSTNGTNGNPITKYASCRHWIYDIANKTFEDYPSVMVYHNILTAIKDKKFTFTLKYKGNPVVYTASSSLHYRTPDPNNEIRSQFTLEAKLTTISNPDDINTNVTSLDDCLALCVHWKAYRCETVVHLSQEMICLFLAKHFLEINQTQLIPHTEAYIYSRSYLVDYYPILGGVALNTSGPIYPNVDHIEDCAMYCSTETTIKCQSFEWCYEELSCHLHKEHFLDVASGDNYRVNSSCIHFSKNTESIFSRYANQGMPSSKHKLAAVQSDASSCAKFCIDDPDETCESFDFCTGCTTNEYGVCGKENAGKTNLCFIGTHHLGESGLKLSTATKCEHYSRNLFGDLDYASWLALQRRNANPYTPGAMTGLAFGMIFLGILVSLAFLVVMVKFKPTSVPKDFAISFVTIKTSGESDT